MGLFLSYFTQLWGLQLEYKLDLQHTEYQPPNEVFMNTHIMSRYPVIQIPRCYFSIFLFFFNLNDATCVSQR